ncbi:MAG: hypothetical protein JW755_13785 [Candidatus Aminicenantes bacterium]|nr:hypothetical protein [Candidatus Aminicenantes bacterium]
MKKVLIVIGIALIVGASFGFSFQNTDNQNGKKLQLKENQMANRFRFMDENGDGISDNYRDFDGDGIPNCQDPDWNRPHNGQGYQNSEQGRMNMQNRALNQKDNQGLNRSWNKNQFRNNPNCPFGYNSGQKNGNRSSRRHGKK